MWSVVGKGGDMESEIETEGGRATRPFVYVLSGCSFQPDKVLFITFRKV